MFMFNATYIHTCFSLSSAAAAAAAVSFRLLNLNRILLFSHVLCSLGPALYLHIHIYSCGIFHKTFTF